MSSTRKPDETKRSSPSEAWTGTFIGFLRTDGHQLMRFATSGLASTGLYFAVAVLILNYTEIRADIASLLAYLAAIGFSYLLQSRFTFCAKDDSPRQVGAFVIVSLAGLAISWLLMAILHLQLSIPAFWVAVLICGVIPATNYFLFKWVVFTQNTVPSGTSAD